ncbi:T15D22.8 [Salix koriyanagi]|uniref:T15D22.8 n=1 Tax=Salix koriyanagi TaxID=2511006 RepID=A0A9Q0WLU0_9ROSI|nr:T15D22.8 [Salix koriyanagi]
MSGSGGVSVARTRGDNRFYVSPGIRKQQQLQQQQLKPSISKDSTVEIEKRKGSDQCGSNCSVSGRVGSDTNSTNLDRFLEYTTPVVPAQFLPKTSIGGWRTRGVQHHQNLYFVLGDLWESFKEWSAYGAGVPLLLNGSETVVQYYVPYLSGIQLYIDPLRSSQGLRRPGEESDTESSRETSSDGSSDYGAERVASNGVWEPWSQLNVTDANIQSLNRLSLRNQPFRGSSSDECEISNPLGRLIFEYMEYASPFTRQPLADQISVLASHFPGLKTLNSCDLSPSSWISVAWYPIYRIPMGPTLQNLDACFLTYHSLSTPVQSQNTEGKQRHSSTAREFHHADMSLKLPLPTFGLASYKFKVTFWNPNGVYECQKARSLVKAADNWLRLLEVNHPDYRFFVSHNTSPR